MYNKGFYNYIMNNDKKKPVALVLILLLTSLSAYLYIVHRVLTPDRVLYTVERHIKDIFGRDVVIGAVELDIPHVILTDVHIRSPRGIDLDSDIISARFSLLYILAGRIVITNLALDDPVATVDMDALKRIQDGQATGALPDITVENGSLTISYNDKRALLQDLQGHMGKRSFFLQAAAFGGDISVKGDIKPEPGFKIKGDRIQIGNLYKEIGGTVSFNAECTARDNSLDAYISCAAEDIDLPWMKNGIDISGNIDADGTKDRIVLSGVSVETPLGLISGKGEICGFSSEDIFETHMSLDLETGEFDYEQAVEILPLHLFPQWLSELLAVQIRDGKTRFPRVEYNGTLGDIIRGEGMLEKIYAVEDIIGQSFGAGHTPQRIKGITGSIIYGNGNIEIKDLSGMAGDSRLDKVGLTFTDVDLPGTRLSVDLFLDMMTKDFIRAWKAAMVPSEIYDLLSPVTEVAGGRIRGTLSTSSDSTKGHAVSLKGEVFLEDSSYSWGSHTIINHSGSIRALEFDTPIDIRFKGLIDDMPVQRLDISLEKPFDENIYSFKLESEGISPAERFQFYKGSTVIIKGSGIGSEIDAGMDIKAKGIKIGSISFMPKDSLIKGKGKIKGTLWPGLFLDISGLTFDAPFQDVMVSLVIKDGGGRLGVKGGFELNDFNAYTDNIRDKMQGTIDADMNLSWGPEITMTGYVRPKDAGFIHNGSKIILDGPLFLKDSMITGDNVRITYNDAKIDLDGSLNIAGTPYYTGKILVDGLRLESGSQSGNDFLKNLRGRALVNLTNLDLYGIPVEKARADVEIKEEVLVFSSMEVGGISGIAKGTTTVHLDGPSTFDVVLSLKNARMRRFLNAISPGETWIDGDMDLEGHLWGTMDSVNGSLMLSSREGKIQRYSVFSNIFTVLNIYKIIQSRGIDLTSKNFYYNSISSTFHIKDGLMSFDDFYMDSNSLQLSAVGKYSLKTKIVDAAVGVQPLESIDKTINMIPLIGSVLTGKDGKFIVVSLSVKGNIDDPTVEIAPIKTLSKSVGSSLTRALKLPSDVLEKADKIIKGRDGDQKE